MNLTADQQKLHDEIAHFAENELVYDLVERDQNGTFVRENWDKIASTGIIGSFVPTEYGGCGYDVTTSIAMLEGFGYGCKDNGLTLAVNGQMWSVMEPLLTFGSEEQKKKYLPKLCNGSFLAAHGMTEPKSGSDAYGLASSAEKVDGGYKLNGHKWLVGLAPACDIALVFAKTNPEYGRWGISAFIVEKEFSGFTRSEHQKKMGLRTAPFGDLTLEDVFVPEENRLGPEGVGVSIFNGSMEWERSFIFASHVGRMARQLDDCVAFANERNVYDQPIGRFQSISNRLAQMKARLEMARLLLYKAAWEKDQHMSNPMTAALAKWQISELFVESSLDAIRIHGGRGYMSDFEVERDLRDSIGGVIYSGTSDIQRNIVARLLGVD